MTILYKHVKWSQLHTGRQNHYQSLCSDDAHILVYRTKHQRIQDTSHLYHRDDKNPKLFNQRNITIPFSITLYSHKKATKSNDKTKIISRKPILTRCFIQGIGCGLNQMFWYSMRQTHYHSVNLKNEKKI